MTAGVGALPLVELLAWDTDFWGIKTARVRARTAAELTQGLVECRELGVRWASMLAPVAEVSLIDSAVRAGFQMIDVRITMSTTVDGRTEPSTASLIEASELQPAQALVEGAFQTSRFYVDTHLEHARCDEFYRTWVLNSFSGQLADGIVASRHLGTLDAFVTVQRLPDGTASLPLVAVRDDRRGVGVGARVVRDALNWLAADGSMAVRVVTQLANIAAIRMYESVGFSIHDSEVWLHHWFDTDEPS